MPNKSQDHDNRPRRYDRREDIEQDVKCNKHKLKLSSSFEDVRYRYNRIYPKQNDDNNTFIDLNSLHLLNCGIIFI